MVTLGGWIGSPVLIRIPMCIHSWSGRRNGDELSKIPLTEYSNRMPCLNQTLGISMLAASFMAGEFPDVLIADYKQSSLLSYSGFTSDIQLSVISPLSKATIPI